MIAAWACQLVGNGLAAASPVYGFNVQSGTMHGQVLQFAGAVSRITSAKRWEGYLSSLLYFPYFPLLDPDGPF